MRRIVKHAKTAVARGRRVSLAVVALSSLIFVAFAAAGGPTDPTAVRPPANTRAPTIVGRAQVGQILRADAGNWRPGPKWRPATFSFQWLACSPAGPACSEIADASDRIYAVRPDDVAHTLRLVVTATNTAGSTPALSRLTGGVSRAANDAPVATTRPLIGGQPLGGAVLTAQAGAWTGKPPIRIRYHWRRCDDKGGACADLRRMGDRYTLGKADVGHALRVLVTAENTVARSAALSLPTAKVGPGATTATAPKNAGLPRVTGSAQEGSTLSATTGTWSGTPPIDYAFQWLRCRASGRHCGPLAGATRQTYTVRAADVGHTVRVRVTATNSAGRAAAVSPQTGVAAAAPARPAPPKNTGQPTISGTPVEKSTLTTSNGYWSGTTPLSFQYRWLRCDQSGGGANGVNCATISGETRGAYVLQAPDVGHRIRSRVIATNTYGTASFNSNATDVVKAVAVVSKPSYSAPPTISGSPVADQTLHANVGSWSGGRPIKFSYQWRRCDRNGGSCSSISGATGSSYVVKSGDVDTTVRVQVTATNARGSTSATSVPTAVIARATPASSVMQIGDVALPNRLIIDRVSFRPRRLPARRRVIARFHVSDSHGRAVQGALVRVIGIPFGQASTPPEEATGSTGYATFVLYPARRYHGRGIVFFVRARKTGERLIGGVSTRRLVFLPR